MSDGFLIEGIYLLLFIIEIILKLVFIVLKLTKYIAIFLIQYVFDVNMIETSKKRKRNSVDSNQTNATRGIIDANWRKLLSSNIIMDKKVDNQPQIYNKDQFTGTFRRAKKKALKQNYSIVQIKSEEHISKEKNLECNKLTKYVAIDCEMVGIGYDASDHMLARVSIVNKFGDCIYDKFVKPREEVKDYRTEISGVRREDLLNGEDFAVVQKEVAEILKGRVLVGHSLKNDLSVLFLSHPKRSIRDTSRYKPFREISKGGTPSLKRLAKEILGIDIQHGEHSSVEDARAAMKLYCTVAKKWESSVKR